jgi:hypothetical protein
MKQQVLLLLLVCLLTGQYYATSAQERTNNIVIADWKETDDSYISLVNSIYAFDQAMLKQDTVMLDKLLDEGAEITHSNGWVQRKEDMAPDFAEGMIRYESVQIEKISKAERRADMANVERIITVKGQFKEYPFELRLKARECWVLSAGGLWKLLTRKSEKL